MHCEHNTEGIRQRYEHLLSRSMLLSSTSSFWMFDQKESKKVLALGPRRNMKPITA